MRDLLTPTLCQTVAEVIQEMQHVHASLPDADGLKWFNFLYLSVTQSVQNELDAGRLLFSDPVWVSRLDVAFANLYFASIGAAQEGGVGAAPRAWRPLLSNRLTSKIARVQFALAGMNAHINRDLVVALLSLYAADGEAPDNSSVRFQDFNRVNQLLSQVEREVRGTLLVGTPLATASPFAPLEDIIAMWSVGEARRSAWNHSQTLWNVRHFPAIQRSSLDALDGLTELGSNGLLIRVLP